MGAVPTGKTCEGREGNNSPHCWLESLRCVRVWFLQAGVPLLLMQYTMR